MINSSEFGGVGPTKQVDLEAGLEADHLALGRLGEALAAEFLEASGYRLVAANYSIPVGRTLGGVAVTAEIDVVADPGRVAQLDLPLSL